MKKTALLLLLLALCLLVAPLAVAEGGTVARSDTFAAYTDGEGHLFLPGRTEAVNKVADVRSVVGIDAYRALYLAADDFLDTQDLYMIDLQSLEESLIATDVKAACLDDGDTAWYVTGANRAQLNRVDLHSLATEVAYTAAEPIDRLYVSAEGLVFQLVDQAATMLYVEETDRFEVYNGEMPRRGALNDRYEVYLTDGAELYLKSRFNYTTSLIDSDVTAFAWLDDTVYYLTRTGSALRLKAYDPAAKTSKVVMTPAVKMKDQLTASGKSLFMLAADNTVCRVDIAKGTPAVFKRYADLTAYNLPAEYNVDGLYIEGMSGQLNVYAQLVEKAAKPTFSFIEFESEADVAAPVLRLIDTLKLNGEQNAWDELKPTPQYATLSRGSRGDAVSAIQQPLKDLGYYDYYVDGIFGPRTQAAVQLLQFDLDRPVTGVADAELQRIILSGRLSAYDRYHQLPRGNRGMRVRQMQERLRELGYLADAADGIFGPRTLKAVQLFQEENGIPESSTATRETLMRLYSDGATPCSSYIDLYPGDTGYRVRELNNRLKELYYLESSPGSSYTSQTTSAVRVFQRTAGLRETGNASQAVQRLLFSDDAPEAPGYIVLRRGDSNERVARLQRRLKELNYYTGSVDGYFGRQTKEAVALFQKKVGLKPTGIATVRTQKLLFDEDAPEYVKPTVIGIPEIYVEDYDYEDDDVYYISEDSAPDGYVIFSWDAEGSVEYYNVRVTDSMGNVYADNDTLMTSTGVSLATLDYDEVYTLRVRAYPEDGDSKHVTEAYAGIVRIEPIYEDEDIEIETIGLPDISMTTVARIEGGVNYLMPGEITFKWVAEGDVGSYEVRIEDESGDVIVDQEMTDLKASISSGAMTAGEIYTISVSAIPEDGNMKVARTNSAQFALPEIELPEPDPTPEPVPEPTPEPVEEPEEIEIPDAPEAPEEELEPMPTFEPEPTVAPKPEDDGEAQEEQQDEAPAVALPVEEALPEKAADAPASEELPEASKQAEEIEAPAEMTEEEAQAEAPAETPKEVAPEEVPEEAEADKANTVSAPQITLDYVEDVRDGVSYVSGEVLTMSWQSEGNVAGYRVELLDSSGNLLDSRTVESESLSAHTSALDPDEVYILNVTAIPAGDSAEGATSTARFALYADASDDADEAKYDGGIAEDDAQWQDAEEEYREPDEEYRESDEDYEESDEEYQEPDESRSEDKKADQASDEKPQAPKEEARQDAEEENRASEEEYEMPDEEYQEPEEDYEAPEEEASDSEDDGYVELDEDELAALQKRLVSLGWLEADSYAPGALDEATVYAISDFQSYCNLSLDMELPMIDFMEPKLDSDTLEALINADERYVNPYANAEDSSEEASDADSEEYPDEDSDEDDDEEIEDYPDEDFDDYPDEEIEED